MAKDYFQISTEHGVNLVRVTLPAAMDAAEFDRINKEMLAILEGRADGRWALDLSGVDYMGSSMLGLLVNIRQLIHSAGGTIVLCGLSPALATIFRSCCLEKLFIAVATPADAVRRARK